MERLELAIQIAREAGELTLSYFNNPDLDVEQKKDGTPVTAADRGAEKYLREQISRAFPKDAILGEEFSNQEGDSGYRWILDPIDGTKSFIHGVPLYSTLVGIEKEGEPIAGVIRIPALQEGIYAEQGGGAWWEHPRFPEVRRAHVSQVDSINEALFLTSEVITFDEMGRREAYNEIEKKSRLTRTWGDAFGFYLVATGRAEFIVDPDLSPWDAGPLTTVLEEAGGHYTDWNGSKKMRSSEGIGVNDALFEDLIAITSRFPKIPSCTK
ncbi:MAG: histidinol-phosphatase [Planctomycetia bacterium]|nr:histidinol-phosphatase [Planctomycetia bacterium]